MERLKTKYWYKNNVRRSDVWISELSCSWSPWTGQDSCFVQPLQEMNRTGTGQEIAWNYRKFAGSGRILGGGARQPASSIKKSQWFEQWHWFCFLIATIEDPVGSQILFFSVWTHFWNEIVPLEGKSNPPCNTLLSCPVLSCSWHLLAGHDSCPVLFAFPVISCCAWQITNNYLFIDSSY